MANALSESVLRALVNQAWRDGEGPSVVAVYAAPRWTGSREIETEGRLVRIAPCVSPLEVRDVLTGHNQDSEQLLVILTDRTEEEIGQEALARIWRHRLQRPSRWEAAKQLFRVERLDPALADARWLVDALVECAPARGYAPPPSGFLDIDTAWRTLLRYGLRMGVDRPSLSDLLRWGVADQARQALSGPAGQHQQEIAERLADDAGPVAPHMLRLVADGNGSDLVPFGLVCEVLWSNTESSTHTARIRFETPLGAKDISAPVAQSWAKAATAIFREAVAQQESDAAHAWAVRAEALLKELEASDLALPSSVLPLGFQQRLARAGTRLQDAVATQTPEAMESLAQSVHLVQGHLRADTDLEGDRVRQLMMAARLTRWLHLPPGEPAQDLATAAEGFAGDGAWVDAAREAIAHGETVPSLADAYGQLAKAVDVRRRARDLEFARALAEWSKVVPTESGRLLPIERVLAEVVGPIAKEAPVVLLVLDGLSYPESIRLTADFRVTGWVPHAREEDGLPIVIAALPTVTVVSRASLLTGSLVEGGQEVERTGFTEHPVLRAAGREHPQLFHKKDLKIDEGRIAREVHEAIVDVDRRVVGVVVNAVDDHLDKGGQLRLAAGLQGIRPLRPLLDAAAEAGRVVVIASDHGHIIENGCQVRPNAGAGERWRPSDTPPLDDEVEIAGPRVLKGQGRIVAPAIEKIRYIPMEKRGYHGGATPQEVLCPLIVMTTGNVKLAGWTPAPTREPEWWSIERQEVTRVEIPVVPCEPAVNPDGQVEIPLTPAPDEPATLYAGVLEQILTSPVMEYQRRNAGRQSLDDESLRTFLSTLLERGGVASSGVLAEAIRLPPSRLRTKLEALRRMLNVDGYAVISIETDGTVRLNPELLRTQFEVDA